VALVTYPDVSPEPDSAVVKRSYSAHQISDGTFLKDLTDFDVHSASSFHHLIKLDFSGILSSFQLHFLLGKII
jgi:hypothetical protein